MKNKLTIWIVLCLVGLASHELIDELIRPQFGTKGSSLVFLLGISPNFIASALIFPFGTLTIRDFYTNKEQITSRKNLNVWFFIGLIVSQISLVIWEFMQLNSNNLVFDSSDIYATLIGGITAIIVFVSFRNKYLKKVKTAHNNVYKK